MLKKVFGLSSRRLLRLSGADTENFLQGIISKDIRQCPENGAVYSFLFNSRGRIQHDLFVYKEPSSSFLIECDANSIGTLKKTLLFYRLRKKVQIHDVDDKIHFSTDPEFNQAQSFLSVDDPRVPGFGKRFVVPAEVDQIPENEGGYLQHRFEWGLAEGSDECGDQLPYHMNGDLVNAVSLDKGCYIGQELTARTYHTGVIRRRVLPFACKGTVGQADPNIVDAEGVRRGKLIKACKNRGIALCSLDSIQSELFIGSVPIKFQIPDWWPQDRR